MSPPALGLVVNPVAGMGGRVGLHGTDAAALAQARQRGATPVSPARAHRAIFRLREHAPTLRVLTAGGLMGADVLEGSGWDVEALPMAAGETHVEDTVAAVEAMVARGVELILFVGGDGTARAVAGAAGDVPVLGVPAGVKMHSAVFGTTPESAGHTAGRFLADPRRWGVRYAEVVDRNESGAMQLFATVRVPAVPAGVQRRKGASVGSEDAVALGREVAAGMDPDRLYLLGPGTTVAQVSAALGVASTPLGVDAVIGGRLVALDAGEAILLSLLADHPRASLILGVVGGQGFLLGRGNQQLSSAVLQGVGTENIDVLAVAAKVAALEEPVLHVDVDDPDLAARLVGYRRVRTGRAKSTVLKVVA